MGAVYLYFDNFYPLILAVYIVHHYIWQSSEIYSSYSTTFAMKIVHNITEWQVMQIRTLLHALR